MRIGCGRAAVTVDKSPILTTGIVMSGRTGDKNEMGARISELDLPGKAFASKSAPGVSVVQTIVYTHNPCRLLRYGFFVALLA